MMAGLLEKIQLSTLASLGVLLVTLMTSGSKVKANECGTKFTDLTSSAVLAQAIVKGSVQAFNPMSQRTRVHSANVTIDRVYKGENVVTRAKLGDVIVVNQFGEEDKGACVASAAVVSPGVEHIFFLRRSPSPGELQMSAFPVQSDAPTVRRVRRSLCPTCIRPPTIKKLLCKNCAKPPVIKKMKSKKVKMGRRARLRCTAKAKPKANFTWTKNGVPVVSGSGGITIRTSSTSSSLLFRRTMDAHAGEYMCKAENEIGKMEEGVMLELTDPRLRPGQDQSEPVVNMTKLLHRVHGHRGASSSSARNVQNSINNPRTETDPFAVLTHQVRQPSRGQSSQQGTARPSTNQVRASSSADTSPTREISQSATDVRQPYQPSLEPSTNQVQDPNVNSPIQPVSSPVSDRITVPTTSSPSTTTRAPETTTPTRQRYQSFSRSPLVGKKLRTKHSKSRLSNSRLKTVFCKDKTYCKNGGRCKRVVKLNVQYCQCRTGFVGKQCEVVL